MSHGNAKDYTGQKYGFLTAIKPTSKCRRYTIVWELLCDCGNVVERLPNHLARRVREGQNPNCGCNNSRKDYTLKKYGMIILTRPTDKRRFGAVVWEGLCECGKVVERTPSHLADSVRKGLTPNCGHANKKDYTGQKYGMLTIVRSTFKRLRGSVTWEALCECGELVEVVPSKMAEMARQNKRVGYPNCGCLLKLAARNRAIHSIKGGAMFRGLEWNLTGDEVDILMARDCVYCGAPPSGIARSENIDHRIFKYSGIDRIDNNKGYTPANCVSCCGRCNSIKSAMTVDELKIHIKKMHKHLSSER